jgi:predicted metal-dependent HD superfamily phosphohydrolase
MIDTQSSIVLNELVQVLHGLALSPEEIQVQRQLVANAYTATERHYHTLAHLEEMYALLLPLQDRVQPWEWQAWVLALAWHDYVYNPLSNTNEADSARAVLSVLSLAQAPPYLVNKVEALVIATAKHEATDDACTNYFTDADMAVLGKSPLLYDAYCSQVRQEYAIFPDEAYRFGRLHFLNTTLQHPFIFITTHFREQFELQARRNLQREAAYLRSVKD